MTIKRKYESSREEEYYKFLETIPRRSIVSEDIEIDGCIYKFCYLLDIEKDEYHPFLVINLNNPWYDRYKR